MVERRGPRRRMSLSGENSRRYFGLIIGDSEQGLRQQVVAGDQPKLPQPTPKLLELANRQKNLRTRWRVLPDEGLRQFHAVAVLILCDSRAAQYIPFESLRLIR